MNQDNRHLKQKARLEEFRMLREEMLYALRSRVWGIASYIVISGAMFAFSTKIGGSLGYFTIIILAIPFIWYTTYLERIRLRISAYIMVVIESEVPGLEYEKFINSWRHRISEEAGWKRKLNKWRYIFSMIGVYDIIAFFCVYLIFTIDTPLWQRIAGLAAISFVAVSHRHINKILSSWTEYCDIFRSLAGRNGTPANSE